MFFFLQDCRPLITGLTGGWDITFFLPPASEGWGRYCFHRCLSVQTEGCPRFFPRSLVSGPLRGVPNASWGEGVPQFWLGVPQSWPGGTQDRGIPQPGQHWGNPRTALGYPLPSWDSGTPLAGTGVPQARTGVPSLPPPPPPTTE